MSTPDFVIIGAMKCATTTLQRQLSLQPGIFMTRPKEPNFFSDDLIYQNGAEWYRSLYSGAKEGDITGEASTHYTKLPTHPHTVERLLKHCGSNLKVIYIIRHPVERLISHYIHEWSQRIINSDIDEALEVNPELIDYSRYYYQVLPYLKAFGQKNVLVLSYDRLAAQPQEQLEVVSEFIGYRGLVRWVHSESRQNVSAQRIRKFPGYELLINSQLPAALRRTLVPAVIRNRIKGALTMGARPSLRDSSIEHLRALFNDDLAQLGSLLGVELSCDSFQRLADRPRHEWQ